MHHTIEHYFDKLIKRRTFPLFISFFHFYVQHYLKAFFSNLTFTFDIKVFWVSDFLHSVWEKICFPEESTTRCTFFTLKDFSFKIPLYCKMMLKLVSDFPQSNFWEIFCHCVKHLAATQTTFSDKSTKRLCHCCNGTSEMIGYTIYFHFEILDQFVRQIQETTAPLLLHFLCRGRWSRFPCCVLCYLSAE